MTTATEAREINGVVHVWAPCHRCSGTGHYGGVVLGGKCFACLDGQGRPTGGEWISEAKAKARKAAAKRYETARKTKKADRLAAFTAKTEAAIAQLVEVGFTNVGELMRGDDAAASYAAQDAVFAVRDYGVDPAAAFADWKARTA